MKRTIGAALLSVALFGVGGCGQNLGSTPQETWKLSVANLKEMSTILGTVKDEATADAALPKLEAAVERNNALKKKIESYNMSSDDAMKLAAENMTEGFKAAGEVMGASLKAAMAVPSRAEKLQGVINKMDQGTTTLGGKRK